VPSPAELRRPGGSKEHVMIAEQESCVVVLHLTDALLTQLHPFIVGLTIASTVQHAGSASPTQQLTMPGVVYDALLERVGEALDEDVRWRPNEYEPEGFIERVQPLALTDGSPTGIGCLACGTHLLANRMEVRCACGQMVCLR
jgi:hypothetical protein